MLLLKHQITKTLNVKTNGRSSDFVTPNFINGCSAGCSLSYCYTRRFGRKFIYVNDNIDEILNSIEQHRLKLGNKILNQTDNKYWTYDICCDTDLNYHWKDYNWIKVLDYFNSTSRIKATFATKFVNYSLLKYKVIDGKIRQRFSMMPQSISNVLEPKTTLISKRIEAVDKFIDAGWDIHINLSPIVYYDGWLKDYNDLLYEIKQNVKNIDKVKFECIFLTHNENLHNINLNENRIEQESLLWRPNIQETKISEYGGKNLRYKWQLKEQMIEQFKSIFIQYFPLESIRYIF